MALFVPAILAQAPDALGERRAGCDDHAAISDRAQIFRRIEAERAGIPDGTERAIAKSSTRGLRAILDQLQAATAGDALKHRHIRGLTVKMNRDDGLGLPRNRRLNLF